MFTSFIRALIIVCCLYALSTYIQLSHASTIQVEPGTVTITTTIIVPPAYIDPIIV